MVARSIHRGSRSRRRSVPASRQIRHDAESTPSRRFLPDCRRYRERVESGDVSTLGPSDVAPLAALIFAPPSVG